MIFYTLHGFGEYGEGRNSTDKFIKPLRKMGHLVYELDYGLTGLAGVRLCDRKLAGFLAKMARPGSVVIAFSNGCAIASFAAEMTMWFNGLVFINPALNRNWCPPKNVDWMDVYYNPKDYATLVSAALPGHRWGAMGRYGPACKDPRITAYDTEALHGTTGHSGVFKEFDYWGPEIIKNTLRKDRG